MANVTDDHFEMVTREARRGRVVPFLGAGANLCGRPEGVVWTPDDTEHLPNARELARHLALVNECDRKHGCELPDREVAGPQPETEMRSGCQNAGACDLMYVSQYVATAGGGLRSLYDDLLPLLDRKYPPTPLHRFLSTLPEFYRAVVQPSVHDEACRQLLIVTTNYDDVLESAFDEAGEKYHIVTYVEQPDRPNGFLHIDPDGHPHPIDEPNAYSPIMDDTPVILKIHGALDRSGTGRSCFVITENQYVDYLAEADVSQFLPHVVRQRLSDSHILFLGYGLRDWNLRVVFRRLWRRNAAKAKSWAIQRSVSDVEREFWSKEDVDIFDEDLAVYVRRLERWLGPGSPQEERHVS